MTQIPAFSATDSAIRGEPFSNGFNALSSEDFIKIIFTELANQDPFQPNDSSALLEQLNSIRSIESDTKLIDKLEDLDDVQNVWANFDISDDELERLTA